MTTYHLTTRPRNVYFIKNCNHIFVETSAVNRIPRNVDITLEWTKLQISGYVKRVTKTGVVLSNWNIKGGDAVYDY